jgi:hypothetical protein
MKAFMACLFYFMLLNSIDTKAQNIKVDQMNFVKDYLSWQPTKRVTFFKEILKNGGMVAFQFGIVAKDLETMTGLQINKSPSIVKGGILGGAYVTNDSLLTLLMDSLILSINQKGYLKAAETYALKSIDSGEFRMLWAYLSNSPKNRITFIEVNFRAIPNKWKTLFKTDLDKIYGVNNTPIFLDDKKAFRKAKKKWLESTK